MKCFNPSYMMFVSTCWFTVGNEMTETCFMNYCNDVWHRCMQALIFIRTEHISPAFSFSYEPVTGGAARLLKQWQFKHSYSVSDDVTEGVHLSVASHG